MDFYFYTTNILNCYSHSSLSIRNYVKAPQTHMFQTTEDI